MRLAERVEFCGAASKVCGSQERGGEPLPLTCPTPLAAAKGLTVGLRDLARGARPPRPQTRGAQGAARRVGDARRGAATGG